MKKYRAALIMFSSVIALVKEYINGLSDSDQRAG